MATEAPPQVTPEDLLRITDRPMPEMVDGQLVERPPMGQKSDAVAARLLALIWHFVDQHGLGLVNGSQGSYQIFPDDPGKVRIPDASFTRRDRVPPGGPAEGHSKVAPDLVVEVVSPNDSAINVEEKVQEYLSAGVPLIWVAYPETRTLHVFRGDGSTSRLLAGDALEGEAVLPGFRVEVTRLFEGLA